MNVRMYKIKNFINLLKAFVGVKENLVNLAKPKARLYAKVIRANGQEQDLGLVSMRVVTTAGVSYIVDSFQNSTTSPLDVMKYHASGTGTTAEAIGDTALVTEVATREAGTQTEASATVYQTVATITYAGTFAITEHGIFSAAAVGTLLDRSVFSAINVTSGDSIQFTYELTVNAGG